MVIYMKNSKKEEAQKVKEELNDFDSIQNQLLERSEYEDSLRSCLLSLFHEKEVDISSEVSGINTNVNCFFLLPNRKKDDFCYDELAQVMLHEIVNYVIPRQKATEAHESKRRNVELSRLQQEAKRKFIDFWKKKKEFERKSLEGKSHKSEQESGEGGELLLFLLAEQILRLFPKNSFFKRPARPDKLKTSAASILLSPFLGSRIKIFLHARLTPSSKVEVQNK